MIELIMVLVVLAIVLAFVAVIVINHRDDTRMALARELEISARARYNGGQTVQTAVLIPHPALQAGPTNTSN